MFDSLTHYGSKACVPDINAINTCAPQHYARRQLLALKTSHTNQSLYKTLHIVRHWHSLSPLALFATALKCEKNSKMPSPQTTTLSYCLWWLPTHTIGLILHIDRTSLVACITPNTSITSWELKACICWL